jgi:hypothetical protein
VDAGEVPQLLIQVLWITHQIPIHLEVTHVIDDDAQPAIPTASDQSPKQGGFARAEKARKDGDLHTKTHSLALIKCRFIAVDVTAKTKSPGGPL